MYINGLDRLDQQVVRMHGLGRVHPPDPLHLVAGVQRFRNALSICLFFSTERKSPPPVGQYPRDRLLIRRRSGSSLQPIHTSARRRN